jgi:DNA gyrase subunit A
VFLSATGLLARVAVDVAPSVESRLEPTRVVEPRQAVEPVDTTGPTSDGVDGLLFIDGDSQGQPSGPAAADALGALSGGNPLRRGRRAAHDAVSGILDTTTRSEIGVVTSAGRIVRVSVLELPALPPTDGAPSLVGGIPAAELAELADGERALAVVSLTDDAPTLALGTADGTVKRVAAGDIPNNKDEWEVISLKDGDEVIGAAPALDDDELVFITSDSSLLHYSASAVRPQGRAAGGMAGIKLAAGQRALFFGVAPAATRPELAVVTIAGSTSSLVDAGTSIKVTPYELYPGKGRATGGVRSQRFLKGEDTLVFAWVGEGPARAVGPDGQPVELPAVDMRRDGSGSPLASPIAAIG